MSEPPREDLAPRYRPPEVGRYYNWAEVQDDFLDALPQLTDADFESLTGLKGIACVGRLSGCHGFAAIRIPGRTEEASYRPPPAAWDADKDQDMTLNNLLDWSRESCAAVRLQRGGPTHDLLFVKPEALSAFQTLLIEPAGAAGQFKKLQPSERLLGYVVVPDGHCGRVLFVVDALLGDGKAWPIDEEDLLNPIPAEYISNATLTKPVGPR